MTTRLGLVLPLFPLSLLVACGTESPPGGGNQLPECKTGNCGQEKFRRAVPTRAEVKIGHPTGRSSAKRIAHKKSLSGAPAGHLRHKQGKIALEPVSPALLSVDDQVAEIDDMVDELFAELEGAAGTTPETESDTEHLWRSPDPELPGQDDILHITTTDGVSFDIAYYIVPTGDSIDGAEPVIHGDVTLAEDDHLDFGLDIELDAYAAIDPAFDGSGLIVVAAMPLEGGLSEHWFDYHDVTFGDGTAETSRTTAWAYGEDSGALEYVADFGDGLPATVYSRWDETGGRYDHHTTFSDPDVGLVDEIATNCWGPTGGEEFDAWAIIDQDLNFYGELDGDEGACVFGPVADHPNPGTDFDDLPAEGEWTTLELQSWCDVSSEC
jgi:hypothetical protein